MYHKHVITQEASRKFRALKIIEIFFVLLEIVLRALWSGNLRIKVAAMRSEMWSWREKMIDEGTNQKGIKEALFVNYMTPDEEEAFWAKRIEDLK